MLFVLAAGTAMFFLLRKKQGTKDLATINQELIIGKWKTIPVDADDSTFSSYILTFHKNGTLTRFQTDAEIDDTTFYTWKNESEIHWNMNANDAVGHDYKIAKLTKDSLQFTIADSILVLFTKL